MTMKRAKTTVAEVETLRIDLWPAFLYRNKTPPVLMVVLDTERPTQWNT